MRRRKVKNGTAFARYGVKGHVLRGTGNPRGGERL